MNTIMKHLRLFAFSFVAVASLVAIAQTNVRISTRTPNVAPAELEKQQLSVCDSLLQVYQSDLYDLFDQPLTLPAVFFMPAVYGSFEFDNPLAIGDTIHSGNPALRWTEDAAVLSRQATSLRYHLFFKHPELVRYNLSTLPQAPQQYVATVDPRDFSISTTLVEMDTKVPTIAPTQVRRRHWIREFSTSLHFSQAYVSPNWYQGGSNNLNALFNIFYNVKLNQEYHPNLLFETTAQYKLGLNNAPDDELHNYNITEDLFQINTTFGVKAAHRWYYSFTGQFKTQVVKSYKSNTTTLKSAFLSPGELTAGVGMTYNFVNKPKTFTFDASIAPISYNLKICTNDLVDHASVGVDEGHSTKSSFGSTTELRISWKMARNITFASRIFAFTNYDYFQADWENTLTCDINRFFTTTIYAHARYDTKTPRTADSSWHKFQLKEIFSIGFSYKFSSL